MASNGTPGRFGGFSGLTDEALGLTMLDMPITPPHISGISPSSPPPMPAAPPSPPTPTVNGAPPAPDPEPALSRRRRTASLVSALGASLVLIAASTFISLRWEEMALLAKSCVLAGIAASCIAAGLAARRRAPGTASALLHLGAFMVALDAGAIATYAGLGFGWTAAVGGFAGLTSTVVLPEAVATLAKDERLRRSPVMEAGRVLAVAAIGLAIADSVPLAATVIIAATAAVAALLRRREATGLALVAGIGPIVEWVGSYAQVGSLLRWLAAMTTASPEVTVAVAAAAVASILTLRRGPFWDASAVVVGAIAIPSALEVLAEHQNGPLIAVAAAVIGFRLMAVTGDRPGWLPLVDLTALTTAAVAFALGIGRVMADAIVDQGSHHPTDVGLAITAALLAIGWLASDLLDRHDTLPRRLWIGASGPIATIGLLSATMVGAVASRQLDRAGVLIAGTALIIGVTQRKGAVTVLRVGLPLGSLLLLGSPVTALAVALAGALVSQHRAEQDSVGGARSAGVSVTQLCGLASLALAALATIGAWPGDSSEAMLATLAIGSPIVAIGTHSRRCAAPALRSAPRFALALALAPTLLDLGMAGTVSIALAVVLLADHLAFRTPVSQWLIPAHLSVGMWFLGGDPWWQTDPITSADWWLFGPAVLVGLIGWQELRSGGSSWYGFGPAFAMLGGAALVDRLDGGSGWHGAVAGVVGLVAVLVGVERRWSSPTAIGGALIAGATVIEVAGVVPRIPVWALLSIGGAILLGFGWALERNAGTGPMASLRSTWSEFR